LWSNRQEHCKTDFAASKLFDSCEELNLEIKKSLLASFSDYLNRQSPSSLVTWSFIVVLCVGVLDYFTGLELDISILYLLPICLVTWSVNRNAGIVICVMSSVTEFVANSFAGRTYSHIFISFWNSVVLLGFFFVSVLILSILKREYERRIKVIDELQDTVSELKRMQEELEQKSRDLSRSNAELEQFASAVSHDLKEPLLAMTIDLKLLKKRYHDKLDTETETFITDAIGEATRMQTLISDMLAYSRVNSIRKAFILSNCTDILNRTLSSLRIPLDRSNAVVTHEALPEVMADPTQLLQLLQNLIHNAVKFRGEEKPRIHISAERGEDEWIFSVRDNGIGVPEEEIDRIFQIYHRAHNKKEYPGSGIGLATCKKIVERHGGRIWMRSTPGEGSSFYFTIPDGLTSPEYAVNRAVREQRVAGL
jgi:signal transduction histidine kinase